MEKTMNMTMYEVPSDETVTSCLVTKESVEGLAEPELTRENNASGENEQLTFDERNTKESA